MNVVVVDVLELLDDEPLDDELPEEEDEEDEEDEDVILFTMPILKLICVVYPESLTVCLACFMIYLPSKAPNPFKVTFFPATKFGSPGNVNEAIYSYLL